LFVLLIVILFIFPATVIRYAQAASATSAMKNNATASANMTENNANMTGKSTENNATASANITVNPGPIVPTPKENTISPMKNTASPTYGCQWPIPAGEGHVICVPN
jgi:hypothetical protein